MSTSMNYIKMYENGGLGLCDNHNGKMFGLMSVSTPSCTCENCQMKIQAGSHLIQTLVPGFDIVHASKKQLEKLADMGIKVSICLLCYSESMQKQYDKLKDKLIHNESILCDHLLAKNEIPEIPSLYFRFEAFGDLKNTIQVANYFAIAKANKYCKCALWSKNPWLIDQAMKEFNLKKPKNLRIIGSSYYINCSMESYYKKFWFIDNCFTVYTMKYAKEHGITINCGAISCLHCHKCYTGGHKDFNIYELLK